MFDMHSFLPNNIPHETRAFQQPLSEKPFSKLLPITLMAKLSQQLITICELLIVNKTSRIPAYIRFGFSGKKKDEIKIKARG